MPTEVARGPRRRQQRCAASTCSRVSGTITPRLAGTENPRMPTGQVELRATHIEVLSEAQNPPFVVNEPDAEIDEAAAPQVPLPGPAP